MNKKGLGKGLQALLPSIDKAGNEEKITEISLNQIVANKNQPRHVFDEEKLQELAHSVKEHGVVQPIIVRQLAGDKYEIVAGERRWRASKLAGLKKIPAVVRTLTEKETSEIALIENIQREDLNPMEEAVAYNTLMEEYGLTQEALSQRVGKSRSFIANTVRLLYLPETIKEMISRGELTSGHARALMALPKDKERLELAKKIVANGLSVRQVEKMTKKHGIVKESQKKQKALYSPAIVELEEKLREKYSTKVSIKHSKNRGKIEIEYYSDDELQRLLESLLGSTEM